MSTISAIDSFIDQYQKEKEKYERIRDNATAQLKSALHDAGIMEITTSRIKDIYRLRDKLNLRNEEKAYKSVADIKDDLADLIGLRVALYFPNDQKKVETIINRLFTVEKIKQFPEEQRINGDYTRRFSGYCATHYRVFLRSDGKMPESDTKERIEIQVASLLMHAWSEVEHDLVYKQKKGFVTLDEYESLDEINGLVLAGELSLRRLQRTTEMRLSTENKPFANHYLLASYIYNALEEKHSGTFELGDVETLFSVLKDLKRLTPAKLRNDLKNIDFADPTPISQQLIDNLAGHKVKVLQFVFQAKDFKTTGAKPSNEEDAIVGKYLRNWISLEKTIQQLMKDAQYPSHSNSSQEAYRFLKEHNLLSDDMLYLYQTLKKIRNLLVHNPERISVPSLEEHLQDIQTIKNELTTTKKDQPPSLSWDDMFK